MEKLAFTTECYSLSTSNVPLPVLTFINNSCCPFVSFGWSTECRTLGPLTRDLPLFLFFFIFNGDPNQSSIRNGRKPHKSTKQLAIHSILSCWSMTNIWKSHKHHHECHYFVPCCQLTAFASLVCLEKMSNPWQAKPFLVFFDNGEPTWLHPQELRFEALPSPHVVHIYIEQPNEACWGEIIAHVLHLQATMGLCFRSPLKTLVWSLFLLVGVWQKSTPKTTPLLKTFFCLLYYM